MKMKTNKFMTYALSAMMLGSLAAVSYTHLTLPTT